MKTPVKILYIEDDELDQRAFLRLVREKALPYEVTIAQTLAEARSHLAQVRVDLIVADYHLPDGDTSALFDEVRDIPFVLITSTLEENLALRTLARGTDDYLIKDVDRRYLEAVSFTVEKTLYRAHVHEMAQELARQLQESEADLNRAQAVAQTGSWRVDLRRNELLWSDETHRIFGIPRGTPMTYEMFLALVYPQDRDDVDRKWTEALRGEPYDTEHRIVVGGELKWVREKAELEFDKDGTLLGGFGTVQDITQRKRAEEALRASEQRYRKLFEANLAGAYLTKPDGTILDFNDAMMRMLGCDTREEVFQHCASDFYADPEFRQELIRLLRKDGIVPAKEAVLQRKDGSVLHALGSAVLLMDEQTGEPYIQGVALDITERKHVEEALRQSEEQFHRLFEDDLTGDFVSTPQGQILLCNPAFATIFGFSRALDAVGTSIVDLYLDPREYQPLLEKLKKEGKIEHLEVWRKRRDGEPIHIVENLVGGFNEQGELYEIKGYLFEDTDRTRAEDALRESERRLALALSGTQTGMYDQEVATGEILCTEQLARLLGLRTTTTTTTTTLSQVYHYHEWAERVYPEDLTRVEAERHRCEADHSACEAEYRAIWPDGSIHWVVDRGVVQYDPDGQPTHVLGIVMDITGRKRAMEALRELTATLESKVAQRTAELLHRMRQLQKLTLDMSQAEDRERQHLAEILHDDLQQQLAAAKFHLGLLRTGVKHDPSLQALAAQINHMLKDAIEKSRSLSHELSPGVLHQDDFAETLRWLANDVQAKHGLVVHVRADRPVPLQSDAIKAFLYRTAQELLFNAVKHAQANEAIIQVRPCCRYICLSVSDDGRGFDPQELRYTAGLGLLSIRERIELLGGRMKIKSAKGQGSKFSVILPHGETAEMSLSGRAKGAGRAAGDDSGRLRVLLADDHAIVRQGLVSLLAEERTVEIVGEASNGREAVDLADRLRPDVVIMDVSMPIMSGDEATRQIKSQSPQTRIIGLSMWEEPEMRERMYQAGAESYVLKTAPSEELLAAIRGKESSP